jgi:hypothetical protein
MFCQKIENLIIIFKFSVIASLQDPHKRVEFTKIQESFDQLPPIRQFECSANAESSSIDLVHNEQRSVAEQSVVDAIQRHSASGQVTAPAAAAYAFTTQKPIRKVNKW